MKRFIPLLLFASFALLCYSADPSIAKEPFKSLALKASGADSNKAAEINNDGVRHFHSRHWTESAEYFEEALKIDPKLAEAHFNLALVLHKKKRHKEATEHFRKTAELAPKDSRIQNSEILKDHVHRKTMKMEHDEHKMHDSEMKKEHRH